MKPMFDQLEVRRLMATFTVSNNADSGAGSLRNAITQANATTAADVIQFNITSPSKTISVQSQLEVTQPLTIDATTQPGYTSAPIVRLNDANAVSSGLAINAVGSVVKGLSITEFSDGIYIDKANVTVEKCYIGLDPAGVGVGNSGDGIRTSTAANSLIVRNNVISGNGGDGVDLSADNAVFTGNIIGLDPTVTAARPNAGNGIRLTGADNVIIGDAGDENRNYIGANLTGVFYGSAANGGLIINNYFGLDKTGNVKLANSSFGVSGAGVTNLNIGYPTLGNRFGGPGVDLYGNSVSNIITDNVIGVGVNPVFNVGNATGAGIGLSSASLNIVTNNIVGNLLTGVSVVGSNNQITDNHIGTLPDGRAVGGSIGVSLAGTGNTVTGNKIANQSNYGLNLTAGANNTFDNSTWNNGALSYYSEAGTNDDIARPVIESVVENANGTYRADITFNTLAAGTYRVSIYESDAAGGATSGHTQRLVQTATLTKSGGLATRSYTLSAPGLEKKFLTAAVTELLTNNQLGSTSVPSVAMQINGTPGLKSSKFEFETGHVFKFEFTSVNSASVGIGDLILRNLVTQQTYTPNSVTNFSDGYRFYRNTPLPDGKYEAVIPIGAVSNPQGSNRLRLSMNFDVLAGDANRDNKVDFDDLLSLAQNYGKSNMTFSKGDFDYDGTVDFDDLLLLAQRYGTTLFSASPIMMPTAKNRGESRDILA